VGWGLRLWRGGLRLCCFRVGVVGEVEEVLQRKGKEGKGRDGGRKL
jgi:hypothetical protein